MHKSKFYKKLPLIGLAPMDGITDYPFRQVVDEYGRPDIIFTEFVAADAIVYGAINAMFALVKHQTKTPVIAQIFGSNATNIYLATLVACEMGFDGVDINMGCPVKKVIQKGGGAALIKTPKIAQECIIKAKEAVTNWSNGLNIINLSYPQSLYNFIKKYSRKTNRKILPVSVKTRLGYDSIITKEWISDLAEAKPDMITLHGRTLKQLYRGSALWDEIGKASDILKSTNILFLGNGDIKSISEAKKKITEYMLDGVLIGRATLGNPWFFQNNQPTLKDRVAVIKYHSKLYLNFRPDLQLLPMRKHLAWYCKGFANAAMARDQLTKVTTLNDLDKILQRIPI